MMTLGADTAPVAGRLRFLGQPEFGDLSACKSRELVLFAEEDVMGDLERGGLFLDIGT